MAIADNLVFDYELDEASGNAVESHGGLDATETSGTIGQRSGTGIGNMRDFGGTTDSEYFTRSDTAALDHGDIDFTYEIWFIPDADNLMYMFGKWASGGNQREVYFERLATTDRVRFNVSSDGTSAGAVQLACTNGGAITAGNLYQAILYHDSVANELGAYINDGTLDSLSHSAGVFAGTGNLVIGTFSGGSGGEWDGAIGKFRRWNRILTSAERTWLYNSGAGRTYAEIIAGMGGAGGAVGIIGGGVGSGAFAIGA